MLRHGDDVDDASGSRCVRPSAVALARTMQMLRREDITTRFATKEFVTRNHVFTCVQGGIQDHTREEMIRGFLAYARRQCQASHGDDVVESMLPSKKVTGDASRWIRNTPTLGFGNPVPRGNWFTTS